MNNYTPFLKLKGNEVMALKELDTSLQQQLIPFFDIPKDNNLTEDELKSKITKLHKKVTTHLKHIPKLYLDNFDLDSRLTIDGESSYKYILEKFHDLPIIPVIGIDRTIEHMTSVLDAKTAGIIKENRLAIRLTYEDFENFDLVEDDIEEMLEDVMDQFDEIELIFDSRITAEHNIPHLATQILDFIAKFSSKYELYKVIITGSSIPSSIADILSTEDNITINRHELSLSSMVATSKPDIYIGDYTIVSPNYSDVTLPGNVMYNVMTPKTVYSYEDKHFVIRGGALKTHPDGTSQFNEQARVIVAKSFFRGAGYSFGDNFIEEKSRNIGSSVMPGTVLKPTINAHITYMLVDYTY